MSSSRRLWLMGDAREHESFRTPKKTQRKHNIFCFHVKQLSKTKRTNYLDLIGICFVNIVAEPLVSLFMDILIVAKKMVSSPEKKQNKQLLGQLNESSNYFISGNDTTANRFENETTELQIGILDHDFGRSATGEKGTIHDQDFQRNLADRISEEFDNAVTAVKIWVLDAILTAIESIILPRVEMAVISITE